MVLPLRRAFRRRNSTSRLEALDRAIALSPRVFDFHDMRAVLLSDAGRFDEAVEACAPAVYGDALPRELEGRAAWIYARRGDLVSAIERMREVVKRSPDYYWGWSMMADWLAHQQAVSGSRSRRRACWPGLAPSSSTPLVTSPMRKWPWAEQKEAAETLRKAFELEPGDGFSG